MTTDKFLPFMMANVQAKNTKVVKYFHNEILCFKYEEIDIITTVVNLLYKECLNQLHL